MDSAPVAVSAPLLVLDGLVLPASALGLIAPLALASLGVSVAPLALVSLGVSVAPLLLEGALLRGLTRGLRAIGRVEAATLLVCTRALLALTAPVLVRLLVRPCLIAHVASSLVLRALIRVLVAHALILLVPLICVLCHDGLLNVLNVLISHQLLFTKDTIGNGRAQSGASAPARCSIERALLPVGRPSGGASLTLELADP